MKIFRLFLVLMCTACATIADEHAVLQLKSNDLKWIGSRLTAKGWIRGQCVQEENMNSLCLVKSYSYDDNYFFSKRTYETLVHAYIQLADRSNDHSRAIIDLNTGYGGKKALSGVLDKANLEIKQTLSD